MNSKEADQLAHSWNVISTFVVYHLNSKIFFGFCFKLSLNIFFLFFFFISFSAIQLIELFS